MAKPKSIVDSYMEGLLKDAKEAVDSVTNNQQESSKVSGSDQDHHRITIGAGLYHDKGSPKDHHRSRKVSAKYHDKRSPKDHHRSTIESEPKRITIGSGSASLSKSQTKIFLWLKQKGQSGLFNKPEIERSLSMPYITVRKAIRKLETVGVLELTYDTCQKIYEYKIKNEERLIFSKRITIGSGLYHDDITMGSGSLNSSSSFFNNTTTNANARRENAENPDDAPLEQSIACLMKNSREIGYWLEHQVTPKQVLAWMNEFKLSVETMMNNLCYARWQIVVQKQKINKSETAFLYGSMKKNGGTFNRPKGYKPLLQLDLEYIEKLIADEQEGNRRIAQASAKLEDQVQRRNLQELVESKINALLERPDMENEYIRTAIQKIRTESLRKVIVDRLTSGKPLDAKFERVLRGHLVNVLSKTDPENT